MTILLMLTFMVLFAGITDQALQYIFCEIGYD